MGKQNKYLLIPIVIVSICILLVNIYYGFVVHQELHTEESKTNQHMLTSEERGEKQKQYFTNLREQIDQKIEQAQQRSEDTRVSVGYYDITTQTNLEFNPDEVYSELGVIKLPLAMLIADQIDAGQLNADQEMWYIETDYAGGTGEIQKNIQPSYTIGELMDYSLRSSDNIATNMLMRQFVSRAEMIQQLGEQYLDEPEIDTDQNQLTVGRGMRYLHRLYDNQDTQPSYARLMEDLKNSEIQGGLSTNQTKDVIAHQTDSGETSAYDLAIVYAPQPYFLVVCTDQLENADQWMRELSDLIYAFQTEDYPEEIESENGI